MVVLQSRPIPKEPTRPSEAERELAAMREMLTILGGGLDMRETLERIARCACDFLEADNGAIGLIDDAVGGVRIEAAYKMPSDEVGSITPFGAGVLGKVIAQGEPVLVQRYGDLADRTRSDLDANSVLGVPIRWEQETIGVFGIGKEPPRLFTDEDTQRLVLFANYAAIVVRHAQLSHQKESALKELSTLYRTSRSMGGAMDIDEVMAAYLDQVATRGRFACSVDLYEFDEFGKKVWRVQRGRWTAKEGLSLNPVRWRHEPDALDTELDMGRVVTIDNVFEDPRVPESLRDMQIESGNPSMAMVPLMVRGRRIGLVVLTHYRVHIWEEAELEPYKATAVLLASAVESRREHWTSVAQGRRLLLMEERQRIARELHDSVSQTLFAVLLLAQSAAAKSPEELQEKLDRLVRISQRALGDMREIVRELRPECEEANEPADMASSLVDLRRVGLVSALRQTFLAAPEAGVVVEFCADDYLPRDEEHELALLRIGQEALSNCFRHARSTHVEVTLSTDDGVSVLQIDDRGIGFDPSAPGSTGFGLTSMRDRVAAVGGELTIQSRPGGGTTVLARLP
ncbi:MAG: hypothetical protein BGO01_10660 [Armatimonadetes bacterium 55-13]|nr:GAF domain-containing sensor histidine kinase [Armatimonadota bacterium]OJU62857.1 MAG: hypothetical protein BGO01_10660 [Armatimonadetes bacterium 55-13]